MEEFGLRTPKVVNCVTDSASNFVKAFKEFGVVIEDEETETEPDSSDDDDNVDDNDDHPDVADILEETVSLGPQRATLPSHLRCACHVINLIAKDAHKVCVTEKTNLIFFDCSLV